MTEKNWNRLDYTYKLMVVMALSIYAIILCRDIVIPLAFASFLALVFVPIVSRLEKKTGTILAVTIVVVGGSILFALFAWLLVNQIISLVNDLPNLEDRASRFVTDIKGLIWNELSIDQKELNQLIQDFLKGVSVYLGAFLVTTGNTLATVVQIPVYMFLILIYKDKFQMFFISLLPHNDDEMQWQKEMQAVTHGYITGLVLVTVIVAVLNTVGLLFLGIQHAIFFGILSGILTIIPYIGIFIGALFPTLMALITKDSIWYAVGVVSVFAVVQFLEGNFITPRITGSKVSINALAAIIALIVGGKILGIAGMILAVPALGMMKIALAYSSRLRPFVILLGDVDEIKSTKDPAEPSSMLKRLKRKAAAMAGRGQR